MNASIPIERKKAFKLQGFESDNSRLVCGGEFLNEEIEFQSEQLFRFLYQQIPCSVVNRLKEKLKKI